MLAVLTFEPLPKQRCRLPSSDPILAIQASAKMRTSLLGFPRPGLLLRAEEHVDDMLTCTLLGPCTKPETRNEPDPNCARTEEDVQPQLTRRRPGQSSLTTARRGLCCWVWQEGTPQHQEVKRNIAHDSVKEISKYYKVTRNQAGCSLLHNCCNLSLVRV